jgi:hypothetical protein
MTGSLAGKNVSRWDCGENPAGERKKTGEDAGLASRRLAPRESGERLPGVADGAAHAEGLGDFEGSFPLRRVIGFQ